MGGCLVAVLHGTPVLHDSSAGLHMTLYDPVSEMLLCLSVLSFPGPKGCVFQDPERCNTPKNGPKRDAFAFALYKSYTLKTSFNRNN